MKLSRWKLWMVPAVGYFPRICLLPLGAHPLLPKDVPLPSLAANRQLRYWASKTASLFKAVSVPPHTAIHYHSNEAATMGGKNMQADFSPTTSSQYSLITASPPLIGTVSHGGLTWAATVLSSKQTANISELANTV